MQRLLEMCYRRLIQPVLTSHDSPEAIGLGVALGTGLALTPTVGVQMPLAWMIATLCGANRVVAVAMVWISNPVTVLPIYYLEYLLGARILGYDAINSFHEFGANWTTMAEYGYLEQIRHLSSTIGFPLLAGSFLPAVLLGAVSYPLTVWLLRRRRRRAAQRKALQAAEATDSAADADAAPAKDVAPTVEPSAERTGEVFPPRAGVGLVSLAGLLVGTACCAERSVAPPAVRSAPPLTGEVTVQALQEGQLLVLLAPYHVSQMRREFTRERLDERLGGAGRQYWSLWLYRFDDEGAARRLGQDGIRVTARGPSGSLESCRPSDLIAGDPLLDSLLGAGSLPDLGPRQKLHLLLVFEAASGVAGEARAWQVHLPDQSLSLEPGTMAAPDLYHFLRNPSRESFEECFVTRSLAAAESEPRDSGAVLETAGK